MKTVAYTVLLFVTVVADLYFGKYVYISTALKWKDAWKFCRTHFTNLAPILPIGEEGRLRNATAGEIKGRFWTGLHWNKTHWKWIGGFTDNIPPDVAQLSSSGRLSATLCLESLQCGWETSQMKEQLPFLCINLVIGEMKSWEEALESCRQNGTSLTSMSSVTELLLTMRKIQQEHITDRVWIGLRFLRNRWMWVDGDSLQYQRWSVDSQDHQCPVEDRCGALNKQGLWENWDCQEKLNFICS